MVLSAASSGAVSFVLRALHSFCSFVFRARARDFYRALLGAQPAQQQLGGHGALKQLGGHGVALARVPHRYPMASLSISSFLVVFVIFFFLFFT